MSQFFPVSQAFTITSDPMEPYIRTALACIDAVHQDGTLPLIVAGYKKIANGEGEYAREKLTQRPLGIGVDSRTEWPLLTTLHEIGHFFDHQALGHPGEFASETSVHLAGWKMAVYGSDAVYKLRHLADYREVNIEYETGIVFRHTIRQVYREYLLRDRELFARSYAQYITQKCHNESLKSELERFRRTGLEQIYHRQWADADFEAIENAFNALFLEMRWLL